MTTIMKIMQHKFVSGKYYKHKNFIDVCFKILALRKTRLGVNAIVEWVMLKNMKSLMPMDDITIPESQFKNIKEVNK